MERIIVTGGAGFIGSNFVHYLLRETGSKILVLDKLTYAGNLKSLQTVANHPRFNFVQGDIADRELVRKTFASFQPTAIVNFAAESHVDRSIDDPTPFVTANIVGAFELLEGSRKYLQGQNDERKRGFRFLHVSTDEVYGSLGETGLFSESTPYAPRSPYAASKASADHLVNAYWETFALPTVVTNCSNNYGPYQFPEKLIPLMILNAMEGKPLPVYGDGMNVRDWLFVEDHCAGILLALRGGKAGEKYNIGGNNEHPNIEIVERICSLLEEFQPAKENKALAAKGIPSYTALKTFVPDRPGHDRRYAIDASKIRSELGWQPAHDFASGMRVTVRWYLDNRAWYEAVQQGTYQRERLGLGEEKS